MNVTRINQKKKKRKKKSFCAGRKTTNFLFPPKFISKYSFSQHKKNMVYYDLFYFFEHNTCAFVAPFQFESHISRRSFHIFFVCFSFLLHIKIWIHILYIIILSLYSVFDALYFFAAFYHHLWSQCIFFLCALHVCGFSNLFSSLHFLSFIFVCCSVVLPLS